MLIPFQFQLYWYKKQTNINYNTQLSAITLILLLKLLDALMTLLYRLTEYLISDQYWYLCLNRRLLVPQFITSECWLQVGFISIVLWYLNSVLQIICWWNLADLTLSHIHTIYKTYTNLYKVVWENFRFRYFLK